MADVRTVMPSALAAAAEAIFRIMGRPYLKLRQCAVAIDKWRQLRVSYKQILLGIEWDTRLMTVGTPDTYREEVLDLLTTTWHASRRRFSVDEMETLVGKLGRIGQTYRPIYNLMSHMYASIAYALRENGDFLMSTSRRFRAMMRKAKSKPSPEVEEDVREINFAKSQVAKKTHSCDEPYRMPISLLQEIAFMARILADKSITLSTPMGQIVDRVPDWKAAADSCKKSGGGGSTHLKFYWFLAFHPDVVLRAHLANNKSKKYISINVLEMLCVCVNLAAAIYIYTCWHDSIDLSTSPVLLNWCDNASATCWVNKRCKNSLIRRALGRFFCGLLMSTKIGIQARWLSSEENVVADDISRLKNNNEGEYDYSQLLVDHPSLKSCR
ncbi:hypothetical protein ACHAXR_001091, partial [Thalassiosira sp. AJA248-18]